MKNQFIPHNLALKLKELGFDAPCLGVWNTPNGEYEVTLAYGGNLHEGYINDLESFKVTTPLWQQAFDFIRNKYLHSYSIHRGHKKQDYYYIFEIYNPFLQIECGSKMFDTYEEARLSCLEKLIELVEN